MNALTYSKFQLYRTDERDLEQAPIGGFPLIPEARTRGVGVIDQPACQVVYEDFFEGADFTWTCWHDEIHYVTGGRAEITCFHPPMFADSETFVAEAGCIYLIPRGTRMDWRVLEGPFRRFTIDVPNPGFPLDPPASATR